MQLNKIGNAKTSKLNAIKEILGHANLSATQVYTHNTTRLSTQYYNFKPKQLQVQTNNTTSLYKQYKLIHTILQV